MVNCVKVWVIELQTVGPIVSMHNLEEVGMIMATTQSDENWLAMTVTEACPQKQYDICKQKQTCWLLLW